MEIESTNFHADYPDIKRYWSDTSQRYAGGDHLLTALQRGWKADETVYEEQVWHGGARLVTVFYIDLKHGNATMTMPVITTPYVRRLLRGMGIKPLPLDERPGRRERRYMGSR